ncbi:MAG TPA: isochorismatase family protein [Bacilli bacterium]|nr:isochorismatase family protein [Bacilli bacterium]
MPQTALVIIDVQTAMFNPAAPVHNASHLLRTLHTLIQQARTHNLPLIYIQHNHPTGRRLEPGTLGWEIHTAIAPQPHDLIIQKHWQ